MEFKIKTMLTIKDLKKRIQVGTKLQGTRHGETDKDLGIREVVAIKGKAFAFEAETNGETVLSWCDYPKASELNFVDNDTFSIYRIDGEGRRYKRLTYKFVK